MDVVGAFPVGAAVPRADLAADPHPVLARLPHLFDVHRTGARRRPGWPS